MQQATHGPFPSSPRAPEASPEVAAVTPPDEAADESLLWRQWRLEGNEYARQRLLALHLPYAKVVAASYYARRFNDEIEFGDYLQLASLGLVEALGRFDPARGFQFRTFAARRMHGAILDGIERATEKQQQIAARKRLVQERRSAIREGLERGGTGQAPREDRLLQYVAEAGLAFALAWILDGTGMMDTGDGRSDTPFYRPVELRQLRQRVVDSVGALPAQEKDVIHRHYFQQMPFEQIATRLSLSRGRISQIHHRALARLKDALAGPACDVSC